MRIPTYPSAISFGKACQKAACLTVATFLAVGLHSVLRAQTAPTLPAGQAASTASGAPTVLSVFEVTGEKDVGYRSTHTMSGAHTLTNLRDTPNSISVINRELIDDLIATNVYELTAFAITGEVDTNPESQTSQAFLFRGISTGFALREGVSWRVPSDTFSIERVEVLRGPQAFLYGEGQAGGILNKVTKRAMPTNFERLNLIVGSDDLYRVELDVNRRLNDKFSVRGVLAYEHSGHFQNHAGREFKAGFVTLNYRPFSKTLINLSAEYGRVHRIMSPNILADQFSTSDRTGVTQAYAVTTGGLTIIPATGTIYDTATAPARRRTTGTGILITDENIMSSELNFLGPDAYNENNYDAINLTVEQRVGENLNLRATASKFGLRRHAQSKIGSSSAGVYRDTNPTRPDGSQNPYFNELYTELAHREYRNNGPVHDARFTAVYDLKLPFMTQRIVGTAVYRAFEPEDYLWAEYVDPASPSFRGTLTNANTLAAYQANRNVLLQNRVYRRYYLKDGDSAEFTGSGVIPGRSVILRDIGSDAATGRLANRFYTTPGHGFGAQGTYFGGRLHSLVGWRKDWFFQNLAQDFHNIVSRETYRVAPPEWTRIGEESTNYGGVFHAFDFLSVYYNYGESVGLSSGFGADGLRAGTVRGVLAGDGKEMGMRWSLLDGRIESNWTYYITNATNNAAAPAVPAPVRATELAVIFSDINPSGIDTQATAATGFEFETVTNITSNWRLTWNFSTNDLETSQRYPVLKAYQAQAKELGRPTPETDAFLASVPDGTPLPGFTKIRSNLVTNYRFAKNGPLKGFSIGGGAQYRDKAYLGNFDRDLNGTAEEIWTSGYTLYNVMLGYRTRIFDRDVNLSCNINNVFDQDYFRAVSLASGAWGEGRSFRLAARIEL